MSDGSKIEWCSATWQPTLGCSRVSPGCDNCYAMKQVHRGLCEDHRGLTKLRPKDASRPGVDWNGTVRLQPGSLAIPLRWKKPRRVFVDSLSDLFHEAVPFEYIAAVFGVMQACPRHTFLVLTKRPERARDFFAWLEERGDGVHAPRMEPDYVCWLHSEKHTGPFARTAWPLPNVHLGTSVEDQQRADERIPPLLACPAAVRWVSAEPLLEHVILAKPMTAGGVTYSNAMYHLGWVVVGGESGPGARPFDVLWARSLIEQARGLPTRMFVKQLGANVRDRNDATFGCEAGDDDEHGWPNTITPDDVEQDPRGFREQYQGAPLRIRLRDAKGGNMEEWPSDLRVREVPP